MNWKPNFGEYICELPKGVGSIVDMCVVDGSRLYVAMQGGVYILDPDKRELLPIATIPDFEQ